MNIYVSNLGYSVNELELKNLFAKFGEVFSAKVIMDKYSNRSKGFGFVEMRDNTAAEKAIKELDGTMVDGRPIKANEAKPREEKGKSSFSKRW
jgi:RNA recognition motif-containing protein